MNAKNNKNKNNLKINLISSDFYNNISNILYRGYI